MAHHKRSLQTLVLAMDELKEGKISLRQAAIKYDILSISGRKERKKGEIAEKMRKRADREAQRERKRVECELNIVEREHKRAEKEAARGGGARGHGSKDKGKSRVSTRSQTMVYTTIYGIKL